jgi:hypothetical protein
MSDVQEVYEMITKHKPPEPGALERQQKRPVRSARNEKIGAFAVAAAIGVTAVVLILANRGGQNTTTPLDAPEVTAKDIATSFLEAYGAFDAERAISYLAAEADITGMTTSVGPGAVGGTVKEFRLLISYLDAEGYKQILDPCEELSSSAASGTSFRCTFDFHALGSDEIGLGPYSGSYFDLTVLDGQIVRASKFFSTEGFSAQMWEPFANWVSTAYPEDAAVMYDDDTHSGVRLTEESIRLWDRHTREYVAEVLAGQ